MTADDSVLLERFVANRDEEAFAELVRRYLNLVYFAALRQVGGDAHRAEDVAQAVFTRLAQKAASLTRHQALAGWLHTTTRFAASEAMRAERRRVAREQEAHTMHELTTDPLAQAEWERLRPIIDEALNELGEADREAVLQRFFANQPLAAIGAKLQVSENAARMRVDRALEKLHGLLAQRGVTSTAAALGVLFANQAVASAPAGLAASVTSAALAGSATIGGGAMAAGKIFTFMSTTKIMVGVTGIITIAATAITWQQRQENAGLHGEITALRQQQNGAVASLRAENERLIAERKSQEDTATAEHLELVQLRTARDAFRAQVAQARKNQATAPATNAPAGGEGTSALSPGMVSMELMQNVGNATPTATAQSIAWGLQHADLKRVADLVAFEPADRAKLEAFIATLPEETRAKFNSPEQVVALMMAGTPRPISGVQLLSRSQPDPDSEVQTVQWQYQNGEVVQNEIKFRRDGDGWKQIMSTATVDRVIGYFQGKK